MSDRSRIEWCDATWNPIVGCTPVSAGCEHCYAARMAKRLAGRCGYPEDFSQITYRPNVLDQPMHWKKPRRIFACSMGDILHPAVDPMHQLAVLNTIIAAPQHTYIVLTKRPENIPEHWAVGRIGIPPNVWMGTTVENQETIGRIRGLVKVKATVRYLSLEPLLGPVDLGPWWLGGIQWVIVGGETGPGARPMHPDWVRSIRDQCKAAGVKFFFKGWGGWMHIERTESMHRLSPGEIPSRLLDGLEWSEFPEVTP